MTSNTISPSIDQAAQLNFMNAYHELAQQKESYLTRAGVIKYAPSQGKTTNQARIGRIDLVEVNTRNPDKQFGDYALDNRQFTKRRFTKTIVIDAKHDINELLKDPTSDILQQLVNAKERVTDRVAVEAALGPVLVGAPDAAPTSISAAADGVLTIDATAGYVYTTVQKITQNFINNEVPYSQFSGSVLCATGKENTSLMGEEKFINNDYISGYPVDKMVAQKAGCYRVELFGGSENGGIQHPSPILPEGSTTRTCPVLAPMSILMASEVNVLGVMPSATKVNSHDLTIDLWVNAMRVEGVLVQAVTTTL